LPVVEELKHNKKAGPERPVFAGCIIQTKLGGGFSNTNKNIIMKTEMDYNPEAWILIALMICATICCLIISLAFYNGFVNAKAFENGYEKATLQGEVGADWVKAKP
jgi:hypothetical protein